MTIYVTDVLTNKQWVLPDPGATAPFYVGQFGPGRFDIRNGGATVVNAFGFGMVLAVIPAGATWNISTQENDRSAQPYCLDYVAWQHSGRFN